MNDKPVPYPEVRDLASKAYKASGCSSVDQFSTFLGGIGTRTVWRWIRGEGPINGLVELVLAEVADGWRPKRSGARP